jgi:hypothetical protein
VHESGYLEGLAVLVEAGVQDFEDGHAGAGIWTPNLSPTAGNPARNTRS